MKQTINNFFNKVIKNDDLQAKNDGGYHTSLHFLNNNHSYSGDYTSNATEAYSKNVIVYRAINLISSSAASIPWKLHKKIRDKKVEIHDHPLLKILHKPNPLTAGAEFFENLFACKMISGDAFIYALSQNKIPTELHILRPDRVTIEPGVNMIPKTYIYKVGEMTIKYPVDRITGKSQVLHIKNYNPLDESRGLSALSAASFSIDQHNEASRWNLSMLKNAARPSGALIVKSQPGSNNFLSGEQYTHLREQLHDIYCSSSNTGRPILLQGGLEWQELSLSPKDMDFIESKHSTARDIALSFGVPPQLLGIPGDSTYNNMQEARLALWEETILPFLDDFIDSLNNWLVPMFGEDLVLSYNHDAISALSVRHEKLWQRLESASFLTINEKRKQIGLSPIEGGDELCNIKD